MRKLVLLVACLVTALIQPAGAVAQPSPAPAFTPGAAGVGDPYFPLAGNGGYDVQMYVLDITYDPATDVLTGAATIVATATQNLSSFNLDLDGLTVRSITVNGRPATWTRTGTELTVRPAQGLPNRAGFQVVVRYDGVPRTLSGGLGQSGFLHTDDGTVVAGEPEVAALWFPVNDHPTDKARFTFRIKVPAGLEAIANGLLVDSRTFQGWTTWTWAAPEPMAPYLATATIGQFDVRAYTNNGIRYWDAVDPDLLTPRRARTGQQFAFSQASQPSYKRLSRTIAVPPGGAQLSFWIARDTEPAWDFAFVEAHTVGQDNWTTLPDTSGHTSQDVGDVCPYWHGLHPFLAHYQTDNGDGTCSPAGTTGSWNAASGPSGDYEKWTIDLSPYAGSNVEVAISYASDDSIQWSGVAVDDIVVSTGAGTTSFEADGNPFDGWVVPGAPAGSAPNPNDWILTAAGVPLQITKVINGSLARQPEIIEFLAGTFGRYPFTASGGIVDDTHELHFALENQTRPIYSREFFTDPLNGDLVVVHELAHQWFGDSVAVADWRQIWLNEGFATYAEWLWTEHDGTIATQDWFDFYYYGTPEDDPFWTIRIGDPGKADMFDLAVYLRGAMTLHELRLKVGDTAFFSILKTWYSSHAGGNATIPEFTALAEQLSGQDLDAFFTTWLYTPGRPELGAPFAPALRSGPARSRPLPSPDTGLRR